MAVPASDRRGAEASYWAATRAPRYSLVFALPLFLLYEGLAAALAGSGGTVGVRNAADVVLKTPFVMFSGGRGSLAGTLIGALLLGNTFVNILASAVATAVFEPRLGEHGVFIVTAIMTTFVLVFADRIELSLKMRIAA